MVMSVTASSRLENLLRQNLPPFKKYGPYKYIGKDPYGLKKIGEGKLVRIQTMREVYQDYKQIMFRVERSFACAVLSSGVACMSLVAALNSGNYMFGALIAPFAWFALYCYRESVGIYGDISFYDEAPIMVPELDAFNAQKAVQHMPHKPQEHFFVPKGEQERLKGYEPPKSKMEKLFKVDVAKPALARSSEPRRIAALIFKEPIGFEESLRLMQEQGIASVLET